MGTKTCDTESFPLCCARYGIVGCHQKFDLCIGMDKATRRELTKVYVERMQAISRKAGRREFAE